MNAGTLLERLSTKPLLLDGGLGSLLIAMGLESGRAPDWWNLDHPDQVGEVHRRYAAAGSDCVLTNTFGANPAKLAASGLAGRCQEICLAAVDLARRAVAPGTLIGGDVGPTGLMLPPLGCATQAEMEASFAEQTELLAAGVDLIVVETMYDVREAVAAIAAAAATGLAVIASMTFQRRKRGFFTIMGNGLAPSLWAMAEAGASVVGANCTLASNDMVALVSEAVASGLPVVAQPNAGAPRATTGGGVYDASPARFAGDIRTMVEAGAKVVGGCCGTDPEFIRAAREVIDGPR
jgi:methionine synthase I (cobalamin-dependent)